MSIQGLVHDSTQHSNDTSLNLKTTQRFINKWKDTQIVVYLYNGILLTKGKFSDIHTNIEDSHKLMLKVARHKRVSILWVHFYEIIEKANLICNNKVDQYFSALKGIGINCKWLREFWGVREVLYILTVVIIMGIYTFVKTHLTVHLK